MGLFTAFDINASGMTAERYRMDIIAENVANTNTTRTEDGTPYRRKVVVFEEKNSQTPFRHVLNQARDRYSGTGVKVSGVYEDEWTEMKMVYDPSHPDADENGYVTYPNVSTITEMTNLIDASRAYEANATGLSASKSMATQALDILRS
ncbi:MAG: flagellar basal body rod protein FlgC [Blautia sp.]|nr:flagellar basal body rod protein FlgC [Lachnoclostridium sp.]MCM1210390.1 flagellar basal body rod protein FlgC [Blautia sp.]